jgi:hypothetical protein
LIPVVSSPRSRCSFCMTIKHSLLLEVSMLKPLRICFQCLLLYMISTHHSSTLMGTLWRSFPDMEGSHTICTKDWLGLVLAWTRTWGSFVTLQLVLGMMMTLVHKYL